MRGLRRKSPMATRECRLGALATQRTRYAAKDVDLKEVGPWSIA